MGRWYENRRDFDIRSVADPYLLCYPLSAINLFQAQCNLLMSPLLKYFCQPLVYAIISLEPLYYKYMGLGIKHLYMMQEICHIKNIMMLPLHLISYSQF
jgi:hypothetical protein